MTGPMESLQRRPSFENRRSNESGAINSHLAGDSSTTPAYHLNLHPAALQLTQANEVTHMGEEISQANEVNIGSPPRESTNPPTTASPAT